MLSYREIEPEDAKLLLDWRTSPRIAAGYPSIVPYNVERQKQWILDSRKDDSSYHWIAAFKEAEIGYVRFHHWDKNQGTCRLGFYIGDLKYSLCYATIQDDFFSFLFNKLKINTAFSWVLTDNSNANKFNEIYGYIRNAELDKDVYAISNIKYKVYSMTKEIFECKRKKIKYTCLFPILKWQLSNKN